MRILSVVLSLVAASTALANPGDLDPTFGTGGMVATPGEIDTGRIVVQPDGKILVAFRRELAPPGELVIARYDSSGVLDPTWGGTGEITAPNGAAEALVLQPDGELLVFSEGLIRRYTTTGAPSPTWGVGGIVAAPVTKGAHLPRRPDPMTLQSDGKVLVAGASAGSFAIARLLTNGTLDASFGGTGIVTSAIAATEAHAVMVQADGSIVAAGEDSTSVQAIRLLPSGALDVTFGAVGVVTLPDIGIYGPDHIVTVLQQTDGKLILAISDGEGGTDSASFAGARLLSDGSLDPSYGTAGSFFDPGAGTFWSTPHDAILQADDKVVLVGLVGTVVVFPFRVRMVRYDLSGSPDPSWTKKRTDFGALLQFADHGARQPDGKLVVIAPTDSDDVYLVRVETHEFCGDSVVQAWEQCDDGNAVDGDCCTAACQFDSAGAACTSDAETCTTDICDATGTCTHPTLPDGAACDDGLSCSLGETCTAGVCGGGEPGGPGCTNPFVCYKSKSSKGHPKFPGTTGLSLDDDIESGSFDAKQQFQLCVPAEVNDEPLDNPNVRQLAYKIKPAKGEPKHVKLTGIQVQDTFGIRTFDTKKADMLLVPADLSLGSPATPPVVGAADHYKCYKVKENSEAPKFNSTIANATEEFEDRSYTVYPPRRLCLPVDKNSEGLVDPGIGLTCYRIRRRPGEPNHDKIQDLIHTADPFGELRLDTKVEKELCMPATILSIP